MSRSILLLGMVIVCAVSSPAVLAETVERTLSLDAELGEDGFVRIENLLGSVSVTSHADDAVRIEARVVAEAPTAEQARALVDGVRLIPDDDPTAGRRVRVEYPLDQTTSFRPPKGGVKGMLSRWSAPVLRRKSTNVEYGGQQVEIAEGRKIPGLAVHLVVRLPFDAGLSVSQAAGTIRARALRGDLRFETVSGDVVVENVFGALDIRSQDGGVHVSSFQGESITVKTGAGDLELNTVRANEARLHTADGTIRGNALTATDLTIESVSGDVELRGVEPHKVAARTDSGAIDLSTWLRNTSAASIESTSGDVTLRVGELANFDLRARTRSGAVKTIGLDLDVLERDGTASTLRHGAGGTNLQVSAASIVVRPYDGSRLDLFLDGPLK